MYRVVINGFTVECETRDEVFTLVGGATPINPTQPTTKSPAPAQRSQIVMPGLADESQLNKWTEPAKAVIARLVEAGTGGLDTDRIAEIAGLRGPKGSAPLLKAIIALLDVGDGAIDRSRTTEGKRRWVLTSRGVRAATKLGLLPAEASRP